MTYPSYGPEDAQYRAPAAPVPAQPANAYPPAPPSTPYPPASAPPVSAAPTSPPPTSAPPVSAPPTQAFAAQPSYPPGPAATDNQPPYGPPPPYGPAQAPPAAPKRRATLVLAVLSVLLLALGTVGFGLYYSERGELRETRTDLNAQLQEQRDIVSERDETIAETEARVAELTTELDATKENLSGLTEERDVLLPCMRRVQEMFDIARAGERNKLDAAIRQADTACSRAQAGLDS
jgi:uncharacterized protein HemX